MRTFQITEYGPDGDTISEITAKTARDAVRMVCTEYGVAPTYFTAVSWQHGFGDAWVDNAHAQFGARGLHGVYARRQEVAMNPEG